MQSLVITIIDNCFFVKLICDLLLTIRLSYDKSEADDTIQAKVELFATLRPAILSLGPVFGGYIAANCCFLLKMDRNKLLLVHYVHF